MKKILMLSAALILSGTMSFAAVTAESLAADYSAQGYTRIEITRGKTQIKVEAIGPNGKVETIYDTASGTVLKSETETVRPGENTTPGIKVRDRNRNFVKVRTRNVAVDPGVTDPVTDGTTDPATDDDGVSDDDGPNHDLNDDHGGDDDDLSDDDGDSHDMDDDHGGDDDSVGDDDDHDDDHSGSGSDDNDDDEADDDSDDDNGSSGQGRGRGRGNN